MTNNRIFEKIKKCLALSKSSNPHEAAAGLRQANALMKKHRLSMSDIELSEITHQTVTTKNARHPNWELMLSQVIAAAFECTVLSGHSRLIYIGISPAPELCEYAYGVLSDQLQRDKKTFMGKFDYLTPAKKRQAGKGFAEGWVIGAHEIIEQFATPVTDEQEARHITAYEKQTGRQPREGRARKSAIGSGSNIANAAAGAGFENGKNARIHHAMHGDQQPERLQHQGALAV